MSATTPNPNPHILVFPYPAQGHMLALLDLTHHLSLHNFTITILITPKNLPFLSPLLSSHPSITPLLLPFPTHPSIPAGVENVKDLGNAGNIPMIAALQKLRRSLLHWFGSHPNPPVAIISDFFLGWTQYLAAELNIPRIAFHSISAFLICIMQKLWNDVEKYKSMEEIQFGDLPGSPTFKQEHLPSIFRNFRVGLPDPESQPLPDSFTANNLSWGSIFNSFESLEGKYLDHLKKKTGHNRVFGVGPLSLTGLDSSARGRDNSDPNSDDRVFTWLDRCPDRSVVYVCFGSQKLLSSDQMETLSSGLEKSGTRFIWVVKSGTPEQKKSGYGVIPDGFEKRVAGTGRVVTTWASQVKILNHKAVGGFLSHCGWNSVLEAISSGVMILAWPMEADQFQNSRLLVEDIRVAVKVCEGAESVPDSDELARVIGEVMKEGGAVKLKAEELREEAFAAIAEGGTSAMDLNRLVEELRRL